MGHLSTTMASFCSFHRAVVSVLLILYLACVAFGGYIEPLSVWPVNNETQGYDVIQDKDTAKLSGHPIKQYLTPNGYSLDGFTYVDIPLKYADPFFVLVSINFDSVTAGTLLSLRDVKGDIIVNVEANSDGKIDLWHNSDWADCSSKPEDYLETTATVHVALNFKDYFRVFRNHVDNLNEVCKLKKGDIASGTGVLRVGGSFRANPRKGVIGNLSCIRVYSSESDDHPDQKIDDCLNFDKVDHNNENENEVLKRSSKWTYNGPYPCMSFPCQNGANCTEPGKGYLCHCLAGYTGTDCENDIDECGSSPCKNEGTCLDKIAGYLCECTPYFNGKECETAIKRPVSQGNLYSFIAGEYPNNDTAIDHFSVDGDIACGAICRKTDRCLSFAVYPGVDYQYSCTLYSSTQQSRTQKSATAKYYILDP